MNFSTLTESVVGFREKETEPTVNVGTIRIYRAVFKALLIISFAVSSSGEYGISVGTDSSTTMSTSWNVSKNTC